MGLHAQMLMALKMQSIGKNRYIVPLEIYYCKLS